jgi:hypothetical protein
MYQLMLDEFCDRLPSCDDPTVVDLANEFYQKLQSAGKQDK